MHILDKMYCTKRTHRLWQTLHVPVVISRTHELLKDTSLEKKKDIFGTKKRQNDPPKMGGHFVLAGMLGGEKKNNFDLLSHLPKDILSLDQKTFCPLTKRHFVL